MKYLCLNLFDNVQTKTIIVTISKNIPNYLTILRMMAIPVIVMTFSFDDSILAHRLGAIIFLLASFTDFLDGYLARKYNIESGFGQMFDPIADKVLVGCVLIMLVKYRGVNEIPCLIIIAREFTVAGLREFLAQIRVKLSVSSLGKVKTATQMVAITILVLGSKGSGFHYFDLIGQILLWLAAILTVISAYSYLKATSKYY